MAEAFKNLINTGTVDLAGQHLQRVWPGFDRKRFAQRASAGLDALEFKARAMQLADALEATLPAEFARAARIIEDSLAPPRPWTRRASRSAWPVATPRPSATTACAAGWSGRWPISWHAGAWAMCHGRCTVCTR